jgi:hypothetical protein
MLLLAHPRLGRCGWRHCPALLLACVVWPSVFLAGPISLPTVLRLKQSPLAPERSSPAAALDRCCAKGAQRSSPDLCCCCWPTPVQAAAAGSTVQGIISTSAVPRMRVLIINRSWGVSFMRARLSCYGKQTSSSGPDGSRIPPTFALCTMLLLLLTAHTLTAHDRAFLGFFIGPVVRRPPCGITRVSKIS